MSPTDPAAAQVERLQQTVAELTARLAALEDRFDQFHRPGEVPEEIVLAISAACAAYLGHRAKVKQVHVRHRRHMWAAQGRSDVQHSHRVAQTW